MFVLSLSVEFIGFGLDPNQILFFRGEGGGVTLRKLRFGSFNFIPFIHFPLIHPPPTTHTSLTSLSIHIFYEV